MKLTACHRITVFLLLFAMLSPVVQAATGELRILAASERTYGNQPAIAILFSQKLSSKRNYDGWIDITDGNVGVKGSWILGKDRRTLYFTSIDPEKSYRIIVDRKIRSASGKEMVANRYFTIKTRKIVPGYGFASRGSVLMSRASGGLPIVTVNVPEVDVEFFRIRDDSIVNFLRYFSPASSYSSYSLNRLPVMGESVYMARYRTLGRKNTRTITHIPVRRISHLRKPGLYVAILKRSGHFNYYTRMTYFFVSDIGLHTRVYEGNASVYASSLLTGRPMPDVSISFLDKKGNEALRVYTDKNGKASFSSDLVARHLMIARRKSDVSVISFRKPALDLSELDTRGRQLKPLEAFVYSGRDLYRPGEKVDVSVLLRDHDGRQVSPLPLSVRLYRPDGRETGRYVWRSKEMGYYYQSLNIPGNAQTGTWRLEVRSDPAARRPLQVYAFKVEEFLPERMKLVLETKQEKLKREEDWLISSTGAYLYGAPADGNRLTAVLNARVEHYPLKAMKSFYFGDMVEDKESIRQQLLDARMDTAGKYSITVKALQARYQSPMSVRVTASVYETGGRPVTRSIRRLLWPAESLVGIRPLFKGKYADINTSASFEVVNVNSKGELLGANLDVQLIREDRHYYWTYNSSRGWHYAWNEQVYSLDRQNVSIKKGARGKISFPVKYGAYRVEIRNMKTGLITRYRFHAGWNWRDRQEAGSSRPDKVRVVLDKPAYRVGNTITATIVPPHAGEALLFVESDRLLWSKRISISSGGRKVKIKLPKEWADRHDLYLSAVVLRPGHSKKRITPNRAVGIAHIRVDRSHRKLDVVIDMPEKVQPSRDVEVTVRFKDLQGQKAMLTLYAVDVGILNITRYKTPDPADWFFARRRFSVDNYDLYGKVIELLDGVQAKLRFGGDAPMQRARKRAHARVKTVALFSGPVHVGTDGVAKVRLRIPDHNGSLRVMAVGFTGNRYGSSDREVIVAAPVVAEIAMPRFMANGDESLLTLDLHNLSGKQQALKVELLAESPLKMAVPVQTVILKDKARTTLKYPLQTAGNFGVGKVRLRVSGDGVDISREFELAVRPAWPGIRKVSYKTLDAGDDLELDDSDVSGLIPSTVDVTMLVSGMPLVNISHVVNGLLGYPYGCLEQTTSRAFPLLYVDERKAVRLGLKPFSLEKRARLVSKAVARLRTMQLRSGGFSLWGSRGYEEIWLTPYVTDFLLEAGDRGFAVPQDMLNKALLNLRYRLARSNGRYMQAYTQSRKHLVFASRAYAAYVLARVQRAPLGTLRTMFDRQRGDAESGLPLVHLGVALYLQGDRQRGLQAIKEGLAKKRDARRYLGDYGSPVRDDGLMLATLIRHKIEVDGTGKRLLGMVAKARARRYLSTQEKLSLFLAAFSGEGAGKTWKATLTVGDKNTAIHSRGRWFRHFGIADLGKGLELENGSGFRLYTQVEVTGYTRKPPEPVSNKLAVQREYYDMQGKRRDISSLRVGELLLVHVQVSSEVQTDNVLLVDLLPAGLEIENLNISQGESLANIRIAGVRPAEAMGLSLIRHREFRDDRFVAAIRVATQRPVNLFYMVRVVSPGKFVVPPPFVEDMYMPEWHAIGKTPGLLQVTDKR